MIEKEMGALIIIIIIIMFNISIAQISIHI